MSTRDKIAKILSPLPGWCTVEKGYRLAQLVESSGSMLSVELGVFGGRSLIALALGTKPGARVDGIDPFDKGASVEGTHDPINNEWWGSLDYEQILQAAQKGIDDAGLSGCTKIIRAKSLDVVGQYADGSVQVLHQDSNHSEEISSAEVEAWAPKMSPSGIWIMDDINWHRKGPSGPIPTTLKAQQMLEARGFVPIEPHDNWCIFQRGVASGAGSVGGVHLGGALLGEHGDSQTWMPDIWERLIADYDIKSVVDVGCGGAATTKWFQDHGVEALGVEGDPFAWEHRKCDPVILHDFTRGPFVPNKAFDLAWTSEFVEHVEEAFMANWMATLRACRFVCMTFATPGQGGHHHVNEQPESYWLEKFALYGFEHVPEETAKLRATSKGESYGRRTLTFFRNVRR